MPLLVPAVLATVKTGTLPLTVTVIREEAVQLLGLVAVKEYIVLEVGDTTIDEVVAPLLQE
jgi:hypothetical protein